MADFDPAQLPDMLPLYYKRLFPFGPFYRWLSYGNIKREYFENREFSFTLAEDIVIRYQAFMNQTEMEDEIKRRCPYKIDIGAVFSHRPKNHRLVSSLFPEEKELVFDIDMTDYDDVRKCCQGADVCIKCWKFMSIAVQVLDTALREDFGWDHLLWVFSGRRGVHCWVCDESARHLDQMQRSAVAEYLQIVTGGENQGKKVSLPGDKMHPSIVRAVEIIEKQFIKLVEEQDFFSGEEGTANVLATIKDESLYNEIKKALANCSESKEKWNKIENIIKYQRNKGNLKWRTKNLLEEIILQYSYPRLDINVSKGLNHLLKAPFCVHPKTGKVCVPFNPRVVQNFNPSNVPTISSLIEEIQKFDEKQESVVTDGIKSRVKDYKKTSLHKSVIIFLEFLRKLEETWKGKLIQISDEKMEF
ncbi:DNA primase small subunit [Lycorma delicatula]|uniref:DNA primase small subunit n=1 Tax=Lycorma delicatula TaxID=130591 RepID=UPI003F50EE02